MTVILLAFGPDVVVVYDWDRLLSRVGLPDIHEYSAG